MTLTIREALQLPDMVQTRLVAGAAGLDNPIRWVTIVEVLEDTSRLSEGEFLITTGYGLEADEKRLARFIPALAERSLSGVAIHTGFYLRRIPGVLIEAADRHGLPLIEVPVELNFSTVTKAILQPIINRQFDMLSYSQAIHEQMIRVALSGGGLAAIADELARLTEGIVTVTDVWGQRVTAVPDPALWSSGNAKPDPHDRSLHGTDGWMEHTVPIRAQERYGTLKLTKPSATWKELDRIAMQHAGTLCALEFVKERAVLATEWRLQGEVAEAILSGRPASMADMEPRLRRLGYPLDGSHLAAALAVRTGGDPAERHRTCITLLTRLAEQHGTPCLWRERTRNLLVLLPDRAASRQTLRQLAEQWHERFPDAPLWIGLSRSRAHWTALHEAAQEAEFTLTCFPLLARSPSVLAFDQLGGYQVLYPYRHHAEALRSLWEPLVGSLAREDQTHHRQWLQTLEVYLEENGNGLKAAERLFIHRHTLTYRLRQLENRTGMDVSRADDRWRLQLALMAWRLQRLLEDPAQAESAAYAGETAAPRST